MKPGDLLGFDAECLWLVLTVDGARVFVVDLWDDGSAGFWMTPSDPRPLDEDAAKAHLQRVSQAAKKALERARAQEAEARSAREHAGRMELMVGLVERLRAAKGEGQ